MIDVNYAISGETKINKTSEYDVVIVGAGIAGLYTALNLDEKLSCIIIAKENIDISCSWLAQGGIAAAISIDDNPEFHFEDTVVAGAGLCDADAVKVLVNEGPSDIQNLVALNVPFDCDDSGELQITREGGHHMNRIVHAGGDATGRETVKALSHIVSQRGNIAFSEHTCLFDILTGPDGVTGVVAYREGEGFHLIRSKNVVIATGGIGQVYNSSTNPSVATGDGIAAAMRAGAKLANIEFIQFHPTGLWNPNSNGCEFLISEAVRGEGGLLVNSNNERFMVGEHELAELAPRDIVARGIIKELRKSGENHVYIDITAKSEEFLSRRFPTIYNECLNHGINIAHDKIPVAPVQHYMMGGIKTDVDGHTNITGLYACGEAANTGVHGANRLASNSMLECLVFGRRAAHDINKSGRFICADVDENETRRDLPQCDMRTEAQIGDIPVRPRANIDYVSLRKTVQQLMSSNCHVVRKTAGLQFALERVSKILAELEACYDDSIGYLEALNISMVANAILEAALKRPKSIGSHWMEED